MGSCEPCSFDVFSRTAKSHAQLLGAVLAYGGTGRALEHDRRRLVRLVEGPAIRRSFQNDLAVDFDVDLFVVGGSSLNTSSQDRISPVVISVRTALRACTPAVASIAK